MFYRMGTHVYTEYCMCVCERETYIEMSMKRRAEHGREGVQGGVQAGKNT